MDWLEKCLLQTITARIGNSKFNDFEVKNKKIILQKSYSSKGVPTTIVSVTFSLLLFSRMVAK